MKKRVLSPLALIAALAILLLSCRQCENSDTAIPEDFRSKRAPAIFPKIKSTKMRPIGDCAVLLSKKNYVLTYYTYVAVPQLDYRFFQKEMTAEEWEDFTLYFPLLKDGALFELTDHSSVTMYDKYGEAVPNGELIAEEGKTAFYQYASHRVMDLQEFAEYYNVDNMGCGKIMKVLLFDMDGDGVRELILQWTPRGVGDYLILRYEDGNYYGLVLPMRGFFLQTSGVYTDGSGGYCSYKRLRFVNGCWTAEILGESYTGSMETRYYINCESVDEDTFSAFTETCETGSAAAYHPRERRDGRKFKSP